MNLPAAAVTGKGADGPREAEASADVEEAFSAAIRAAVAAAGRGGAPKGRHSPLKGARRDEATAIATARRQALRAARKSEAKEHDFPTHRFALVVKDICQDLGSPDIRFSADALACLRSATEQFICAMFSVTNQFANHAHRVTVQPRDVDLYQRVVLKAYAVPGYLIERAKDAETAAEWKRKAAARLCRRTRAKTEQVKAKPSAGSDLQAPLK